MFGALLFGIAFPVAYSVLASNPTGGMGSLLWLIGSGVVVGAILGAMFPKVFGFVFEIFLHP